MNKNTKNIFVPILTVLLFAALITACDDPEASKDKPSSQTYTIGEIKHFDNKDLSGQFTDILVRGTTATFTIVSEDENENESLHEFTLPIENGIAKEVTLVPIVINFTDAPVYYRVRIEHDGMGDDRENYIFAIVTNTDKSALDDARYPVAEYTALQMLEKKKIAFPFPDRDNDTGVPKRDTDGRPMLEIITGTITKK